MKACTPDAFKLIHEGILTLAQVERNGIKIDTKRLKKAMKRTAAEIKVLDEQLKGDSIWDTWRQLYGKKTNLNSHKQLEKIIFEELEGEYKRSGRTTEKGEYSADEAAFERVKIPFVKRYFQKEKKTKALNTYLTGIDREVVDGYMRPIIDLHTAITFRSSANRPNIQNFPVRQADIAEIIRRCVVAPNGYRIGEIDFSGVEVCGSCCYHKDPAMIKYVENPESNMHLDLAVQIFKIKKEDVSKRLRNVAKNGFVFPEFYGSWWEDCAASMWDTCEILNLKHGKEEDGISIRKYLAKKDIKTLQDFEQHVEKVEKYFWDELYKVYKQWKYDWWDLYVQRGWFSLLSGFTSQGLYNRKQVCNAPIQGSSFHMLLWSMIQLQKWLNKHKMKSKIIAEVHDSLLMYFHEKEIDDVLHQAQKIMTKDIRKHWPWIIVPMSVEAEVAPEGGSWFDKLGVEIK